MRLEIQARPLQYPTFSYFFMASRNSVTPGIVRYITGVPKEVERSSMVPMPGISHVANFPCESLLKDDIGNHPAPYHKMHPGAC